MDLTFFFKRVVGGDGGQLWVGVLVLQLDFLVHHWRYYGCKSARVDQSDKFPFLFYDRVVGLNKDYSENEV